MQKSARNQKAGIAHRKVRTSTVKSRKTVRRPSKVQKRNIKVIDRDSFVAEKKETKQLKEKKEIKILPTIIEQEPIKDEGAEIKTKQVEQEQETKKEQVGQKQETKTEQAPQKAQVETEQKQAEFPQADLTRVHERMRARTEPAKTEEIKLSAKEIKEQAIKKALGETERAVKKDEKKIRKAEKEKRFHFGVGRTVLALSCAAAAVFAIVYFVNLSAPDLSLRVTAMQTGIEATYPSYVPRDFSLSDITSEDGKINMNFVNHSTGDAFSLSEEKSSWDSNALLENFVKVKYGEDYAIIKENGLTIYIKGSDACWVNAGMVFKLDTTSGSLTKKQIRAIAVSL